MRTSQARRTIRTAALGMLLGITLTPAAMMATPARASGVAPAEGAAGPLQPPAAALVADGAPGDGDRAVGAAPVVSSHLMARAAALPESAGATMLPASADLTSDAPPVGYQGQVNSCVSWVTGYYMRGWYARRDGYYPAGGAGGFAPMYLYSQIANGQNGGTTFNDNLSTMQAQGVDTRADYAQGDVDYVDGPTSAERQSAAGFKIASWATLFIGAGQGATAQQAIEASIAGGNPVGIGIPVYDNFYNANPNAFYIDGTPGVNHGNHAVFAAKYDANGLWVENQWGTGWGLNGWVELSWSFVDQYAWQAVTMRPAAVPAATATPAPSASATAPTATATAVLATATSVATQPLATATATDTATSTPAPVPPTATATATPVPPAATPVAPSPTPQPHLKRAPSPLSTTTTTRPRVRISPAPSIAHAPARRVARRPSRPRKQGRAPLHAHAARHTQSRRAMTAPGLTLHLNGRHMVTYRDLAPLRSARSLTLRLDFRAAAPGLNRRAAASATWLEVAATDPHSGHVLCHVLRVHLTSRAAARHDARVSPAAWRHVTYNLAGLRGHHVRLIFRERRAPRALPLQIDIRVAGGPSM